MTTPRRWVGLAALVLACALVLWLTRYEYVGVGARIVRVNRWTGATAILTRSAWRPIAPTPTASVDALDSLARASGVTLPVGN